MSDLVWSRWPWDRCKARHRVNIRCDLRMGHDGPHAADRGMYLSRWVEVWAEDAVPRA